ncbi:hypothetical protein ABZ682_14120 [Streptomyces griseoviridis]|uniref:hypothetical protein n=1 Tax=Streptomyces griseoviridis TaxID=45398 RepID=UPI0033ED10F4
MLSIAALLGWPVWTWFSLTALAAGSLLLGMYGPDGDGRVVTHEVETENVAEFPIEPPYLSIPVVDVPLPSGLENYPFLFSAMIRWRTRTDPFTTSHGNPGALAVASVLRRAQRYTESEHPNRLDFLSRWLEGLLGQPVHDESDLVTAYATDVHLRLRPEDRQDLDALEGHRRGVGAWERQRDHELDRRAYFGEDVLQSPGSAIVWWLSRHENEIQHAVDLIGPLSCLSAAANDRKIPDGFLHLVGKQELPAGLESPVDVENPDEADTGAVGSNQNGRVRPEMRNEQLSDWLNDMDFHPGSAERTAFVHRIAHIMAASGRPQAAERLRASVGGEVGAAHGSGDDSVQEATGHQPDPDGTYASRPTTSPLRQKGPWPFVDQRRKVGRSESSEASPSDEAATVPTDSYSPSWPDAEEKKPS